MNFPSSDAPADLPGSPGQNHDDPGAVGSVPRRHFLGGKRQSLAVIIVAIAATVAGAVMVVDLRREIPVREATIGNLFMRLDRAEWLDDQMEHSDTFPMPQSMMPGMPTTNMSRLSAELQVQNPGRGIAAFNVKELFLEAANGSMWPVVGSEVVELGLEPGQSFNTFAFFDVDHEEIGEDGDLRLIWMRDGIRVFLTSVEHPPAHDLDDSGGEGWPEDVALLPGKGDPAAGEVVYEQTFYCISCHGTMSDLASNTLGPHLGNIGNDAASRSPGKSAAAYLYESLLEPNAFIAPSCGAKPCSDPSMMPPFKNLMRAEQMQDLLAYLASQRRE
jgi:mono/diheme cytochrome c family protein